MTSPLPDEERDEPVEDVQRDEESAARRAELFYPSCYEFVTDRLAYLVPLPTPESGQVWCPEWYLHAQAISRLDALWRAWESLRFEADLGISNWWIHHVDPHMRVLLDPVTGPFARCAQGHERSEPLPTVPPPPGLFEDQRHTWLVTGDPFALD